MNVDSSVCTESGYRLECLGFIRNWVTAVSPVGTSGTLQAPMAVIVGTLHYICNGMPGNRKRLSSHFSSKVTADYTDQAADTSFGNISNSWFTATPHCR
jgi:CO dehydrogenase/acetyl-CoA synthase epsilon subunit